MHYIHYLKTRILLVFLLTFSGTQISAQLIVDPGGSTNDIIEAIIGPGVTYSNVVITCDDAGYGMFTGGDSTPIGIDNGVLLTSGIATGAVGPNDLAGFSGFSSVPGDADLDDLISPLSTNDACILEFDFVATSNNVGVNYVFASEEYDEFVCSVFNDVFAFFITGPDPSGGDYTNENLAVIGTSLVPVAINNVNNGHPTDTDCIPQNTDLFVSNPDGSPEIQYDGFTVVFNASAEIVIGEEYHFKIAIADASDSSLDSGVFIEGQSFTTFVCDPGVLFIDTIQEFCVGEVPVINVSTSSGIPGDYAYVVTNDADEILEIITYPANQVDLSAQPFGDYKIYGLSWDGTINGLLVGENLLNLSMENVDECFALSNPIIITIQVCCELIIECPDADGGSYTCADQVPTVDYSLITILNSCEDPIITHTDDVIGEGCPDSPLTITRTYYISHENELLTCVQSFSVIDNVPPVLSNVPEDILIDCADGLPTDLPDTSDNCDPNPLLEVDLISPPQQFTSDPSCQLRTQTQGGWGSPANGNNPGVYRDANFDAAFPNGLVLGCDILYTLTLTSAQAVEDFLPTGGTPAPLTESLVDPDSYNVFAAQLTALGLSLGFDANDPDFGESDTSLSDLIINNGTFENWTVGELFEYANAIFGGCSVNFQGSDFSPSQISDALAMINENFVGGEIDLGNLDCPNDLNICEYDVIRLFTLTDNCMNVVQAQQTVTIADNLAPVLTNLPLDTVISCGDDLPEVANVGIEDNCDDNPELTFAEEIVPIDDCTHEVWRYWQGVDECGNTASHLQIITVIDDEAPTLIGVPLSETINCSDPIPAPADVTIEDTCDLTPVLTFSEESNFDDCPATITRTWTGVDACGNSVEESQVITIVDNNGPTLLNLPGDVALNCDDVVPPPAAVTIEDDCDVDPLLTYSEDNVIINDCISQVIRTWTGIDECDNETSHTQVITISDMDEPELQGVPADLQLTCLEEIPVPPVVTVTDNCDDDILINFVEEADYSECPYTITRTWSANDDCFNSISETQVITIIDEIPPVIEEVEPYLELECDDISGLSIVATDDCSEVTITYEDLQYSGGGCYGIFERTWYATDACGNVSTASQIIEVMDETAPVFVGLGADDTIECNEPYEVPVVTAIDNCLGAVPVTFNETIEPGDCPAEMVITWVWTAEDECGNMNTGIQVLTIVDSTPPVIGLEDGDFELPCDEYPPLPDVLPTDNCSDSENIIFGMTETVEDGSCGGTWIITRTYSAEDECGNMSGVIQTFYGMDEVPPVFLSHGADLTISCEDEIPAPEYDVEDNCSDIIAVVATDVIVPTNCPSEYTIIRTYVATDECDNSSTEEQIITVIDDIIPEFVDPPEDIFLNCGDEIPDPSVVEATDTCDGEVAVTLEITYAGDAPDEDALTYCTGEDPIGQEDPAWSLVLFDTPTGTEYYTTVEAHWVTYADEGEGQTAHLYGSVVSSSNPGAGWDFDVWFYNGEGWDEWISEDWPNWYKNDPDNAGLNYLDWMYYLTNADESSLTGWGDLEGSYANLSHLPDNNYYAFQEGFAANNATECFGIGGWLQYDGYLIDSFNGIETEINGGSDFSFCLDCCPEYQVIYTYTAEDCAGNIATHTQTVTIDDTEALANEPQTGGCLADFNHNGEVDIIDFIMLSSEFGCQSGACQCDLDGNGHVNTIDMIMFSSMFGMICE